MNVPMRFLLSRSALLAAVRQEREMVKLLSTWRPKAFAVINPVIAEIHYGIHRADLSFEARELVKRQVKILLRKIPVIPWSADDPEAFAVIKAQTGLADADVALALTARAHSAPIITVTPDRFVGIEGVTAQHWSTVYRQTRTGV